MSMSPLDCYLDSKMDELLHRSSDINGNFSQNLFSQYERQEIERFVSVLVSENQKLQAENEKLKQDLEIVVKALEFYGGKENWLLCKEIISEDYETQERNSKRQWECGGKTARQALEKIKNGRGSQR